jgi:hypothetical protein
MAAAALIALLAMIGSLIVIHRKNPPPATVTAGAGTEADHGSFRQL